MESRPGLEDPCRRGQAEENRMRKGERPHTPGKAAPALQRAMQRAVPHPRSHPRSRMRRTDTTGRRAVP
jgi:hypothetical protein